MGAREQDHKGSSPKGVGTGREDRDLIAIFELELDLSAFRTADPVLLHNTNALRPFVQQVQILYKSVRVFGYSEEPLLYLAFDDRIAASPT